MPGGGGGDQKSTTTQELSPEQKQLLNLATPIFKNYLQLGATGLSGLAYPGSGVSGFTPAERQGQSMLMQQAKGPLQQAANTSLEGLNFLTSGRVLDPNTNPGLRGAIDAAARPLTENFQQVVMPEVRSDMILGGGGYGSNRQGIETANASNMLMRNIGDVSSNLTFQGYNAGLDAMGRGLAVAPSVMQGAQLPGQTVAAVGAQQRGMQQARVDDRIQRWYNQRFFPLSIAQQIAGTAFGMPGGSTVATANGGGGGFSGAGALSGAMGGASIGTAIMPGLGTGIGAGLGALMGFF